MKHFQAFFKMSTIEIKNNSGIKILQSQKKNCRISIIVTVIFILLDSMLLACLGLYNLAMVKRRHRLLMLEISEVYELRNKCFMTQPIEPLYKRFNSENLHTPEI